MHDILINNPYRILKIYTDDKTSISNVSILRLSVSHGIYQFCDLRYSLNILRITPDLIDFAENKIKQYHGKIKYAFFWFMKGEDSLNMNKTMDDMLKFEDFDVALHELGRMETMASIVNRSVIQLIKGNLAESILLMNDVLSDSIKQKEFLKAVCDESLSVSQKELQELYLSTLCKEYSYEKIKKAVSTLPELNAVLNQFIDEKKSTIANEGIGDLEKSDKIDIKTDNTFHCFFCGETTKGKERFVLEKKHYKSSKISNGVVKTTYTKRVDIPTCPRCRDAIKTQKKWHSILSVCFSIVIFIAIFLVTYFYFDWDFLLTLFVVVLPGWFIAGLSGPLLSLLFTPLCIRLFDKRHWRKNIRDIKEHPTVIKLIHDGYELQ